MDLENKSRKKKKIIGCGVRKAFLRDEEGKRTEQIRAVSVRRDEKFPWESRAKMAKAWWDRGTRLPSDGGVHKVRDGNLNKRQRTNSKEKKRQAMKENLNKKNSAEGSGLRPRKGLYCIIHSMQLVSQHQSRETCFIRRTQKTIGSFQTGWRSAERRH